METPSADSGWEVDQPQPATPAPSVPRPPASPSAVAVMIQVGAKVPLPASSPVSKKPGWLRSRALKITKALMQRLEK